MGLDQHLYLITKEQYKNIFLKIVNKERLEIGRDKLNDEIINDLGQYIDDNLENIYYWRKNFTIDKIILGCSSSIYKISVYGSDITVLTNFDYDIEDEVDQFPPEEYYYVYMTSY